VVAVRADVTGRLACIPAPAEEIDVPDGIRRLRVTRAVNDVFMGLSVFCAGVGAVRRE
jgi:hypothetical protein